MKQALYEGNDVSHMAVITRDKHTKAATLAVNAPGGWSLYAGSSPAQLDFHTPVASGTSEGNVSLAVPDSVRSYFQFVVPEGKVVLAERHLPMTGGFNFRDLGGYRTHDGRHVQWGKLIRSDELHTLTDADLGYLSSIPVRTIVDFRSDQEIETSTDKIPASTEHTYRLSMVPGNLQMAVEQGELDKLDFDSLMTQLYGELAGNPDCIEQYRTFFRILQNGEQSPVLFHCTAGKDRTGVGAALILYALDVEPEVIMQDYLLSNIYLKDKYAKIVEEYPQLAPALGVKPGFLQAAVERVEQEHGSIQNFLTQILDVDLEHMRELYLD